MEALKIKTQPDSFSIVRRRMVEEQLVRRKITDQKVLKIMGEIPRHLFVEEALQDQAYGDYPVGIGEGQTISQPYIVALMTQILKLTGSEKVLEIGTGCGYQTSILASLSGQVYTIERVKLLALKARRLLKFLGFRNIVLRIGDGSQGWKEGAPFDKILIAAASPEIPEPLVDQLAEGGSLILPVGSEDFQQLTLVTKKEGKILTENFGDCRFVKLVGRFGWGNQKMAGDKFVKRSLV